MKHPCNATLPWAVTLLVAVGCADVAQDDDGRCDTRVSGTVTVPNGVDPLPDAVVYLAGTPPAPFSDEISCEACVKGDVEGAVALARSGPDGRFTLHGLPAGDLTLHVQKGRWRRAFPVHTTLCQQTDLAKDAAHLPRTRAEGDLPRIAVGVGDYDAIECVLRHIGLGDGEFTSPTGGGAVHLYENEQRKKGGAPGGVPIESLLIDPRALRRYQLLLFNCTDLPGIEPFVQDLSIMANLRGYVAEGGRLYATDWAYNLIAQQRDWSAALCFDDGAACGVSGPRPLQGASRGSPLPFSAYVPGATPQAPAPAVLDGLRGWLRLPAFGLDGNVRITDVLLGWALLRDATAGSTPPPLTWLRGQSGGIDRPLTATFDYPQPRACGRVLYSSYHTRGHQVSGVPFPAYCPIDLLPQERVLEYLLFEVSTCVAGPG